jgi:hypothetical protein
VTIITVDLEFPLPQYLDMLTTKAAGFYPEGVSAWTAREPHDEDDHKSKNKTPVGFPTGVFKSALHLPAEAGSGPYVRPRGFAGPEPRSIPTTKLIRDRIRNTNNRPFPISIETPANPVAPKMMATNAKTKKTSAARSIKTSFPLKNATARPNPIPFQTK